MVGFILVNVRWTETMTAWTLAECSTGLALPGRVRASTENSVDGINDFRENRFSEAQLTQ